MKAAWISMVALGCLTLFFQNCGGQVGFKTQSSEILDDNNGSLDQTGDGSQPTDLPILPADETSVAEVDVLLPEETALNMPQSQNMGGEVVSPAPPMPPSPPTTSPSPGTESGTGVTVIIDNNQNLSQPVSFAACTSFVELSGSELISLPPRESGSTCYFVRLMTAIANRPSGSAGELRASDVMASNHNGNSSNYISPFILGERAFQIHNLRNWKLAVSGASSDPLANMRIDNFYLLQMEFGEMATRQSLVSAFGTADAQPGRTQPILLNGQPVPFQSFAPGGTAVVNALDLTPPSAITATYTGFYSFRFRALDCGGSAAGSDVFAVFH